MNMWATVYLTLVGLALGSFAGCLAYRLGVGGSVLSPARSFCPRCGTVLSWRENIPVVSYLMLRGRCRHCGEGISIRYLFIELFLGGCALGLALVAGSLLLWCAGMTLAFGVAVLVALFCTKLL